VQGRGGDDVCGPASSSSSVSLLHAAPLLTLKRMWLQLGHLHPVTWCFCRRRPITNPPSARVTTHFFFQLNLSRLSLKLYRLNCPTLFLKCD
jgi:hypothetical protein